MALWKKVLLELEQSVGARDIDGRRLFNSFLHAGGRKPSHQCELILDNHFPHARMVDVNLGTERVSCNVYQQNPHHPKKQVFSRRQTTDEAIGDRLLPGDSITDSLIDCPFQNRVLSVPKSKYFNDACRFINCWLTQKQATKFPKMQGTLHFNNSQVWIDREDNKSMSDTEIMILKNAKKMAAGTYGQIFEGTLTTSERTQKAIVKINLKGGQSDIVEAIIQVVCFCYMRSVSGPMAKFLTSNRYAKIPKLLSLSRIDKKGGGAVNMLAMQPLKSTLANLLQRHKRNHHALWNYINEALLQIATTLFVLKRGLQFEHRDFHAKNVMYRTLDRGRMQFYLIDFGMSRLVYNEHKVEGRHFKDKDLTPGGDMAMLMVHIYQWLCIGGKWNKQCLGQQLLDPTHKTSQMQLNLLPSWSHTMMKALLNKCTLEADQKGIGRLHFNMYRRRVELREQLEPFAPENIVKTILRERGQIDSLRAFEELVEEAGA